MNRIVLRLRQGSAAQDQQGAVLIIVASVLAILGALLVSVQMGYDFLQEQRLQKTADLAALSAVQVLGDSGDCAAAQAAATSIAAANGFSSEVVPTCGNWNQAAPTSLGASSESNPANAMQVQVSGDVPSLLPDLFGGGAGVGAGTLTRHAIATAAPPVAAFSVGSRLLSLKPDGLVADIARPLGLDLGTLNLIDPAGLANVMVTPSGLLQAVGLPPSVLAGIGTTDEVAELRDLTLGQLLTAYATVLGQNAQASSDAVADIRTLGQSLVGTALNIPVTDIFTGPNGLLAQLSTSDVTSALNTQISLGDLIGTGIALADTNHLASVNLGSNLAGLLNVEAWAKAISKPTVVVGGVGTQGTNTQVSLFLHLQSNNKSGLGALLNSLLSINLPIILNMASSTVGIVNSSDIDCTNKSVKFTVVDSSPARLCLGNLDENSTCASASPPSVTMLELSTLLGLGQKGINGSLSVAVNGLTSSGEGVVTAPTVQLFEDPEGIRDHATLGAPGMSQLLTVGAELSNILSHPPAADNACGGLLSCLGGLVGGVLTIVNNVLTLNWQPGALGSLLNPVLDVVNTAAAPVLKSLVGSLGINVGETDIKLYGVTCGIPQLVQ